LVPPSIFGSRQMTGGLVMFLVEYLAQAGLFFTIAALEVNRQARVAGLQSALAVLALIALLGLFSARRIPSRPPQSSPG
jgi:hypothetical protein